jgi:uncharacterized protein (TIGR02246 family)
MASTESDAAARRGVEAAYARWFASMETGDVALGLSAVTDDVVHHGPEGPPREGKNALGSALRAFHAAYVERVRWEIVDVVVTGDRARARIHETATIRPRDGGASIRVSGQHTGELVRGEAGRWRIAQDVSTIDGAPTVVEHEFDLPDG